MSSVIWPASSTDYFTGFEGAFENLKRFTSDASHELRTPLASMRSVGEVALQHQRLQEEYRDIIGSMLEEGTRLTATVDALLSMSRADAGRVEIDASTYLHLLRRLVHASTMPDDSPSTWQRGAAKPVPVRVSFVSSCSFCQASIHPVPHVTARDSMKRH